MPRRSDFIAEELREWIGWLHLLRPVPVGDGFDFVYEVFSTRSSIGDRHEMTGKRVGEWDDDRVTVAMEFYRAVKREKSPVAFAAPERFEKDFIAFRRIALPFGDETGITHILTHLSERPTDGTAHREPARLDIETIQDVLRRG